MEKGLQRDSRGGGQGELWWQAVTVTWLRGRVAKLQCSSGVMRGCSFLDRKAVKGASEVFVLRKLEEECCHQLR